MISKKILLLGICTLNSLVMPVLANSELAPEQSMQQAPVVEKRQCNICTEFKEETAFTQLECWHNNSCNECLIAYLKLMIESRQLHNVACPRCHRALSYQAVVNLLGNSNQDALNLYNQLINFRSLRQEEGLKHCPTPDCTFYFINESTCAQPITCPRCEKQYCNQCLVNHDAQITCDHARINNQTPESQANTQWKETHSKQCPRCKTHIEKNDGCNHMTCNNCRYEFCWICLERYPCPRGSYCPHPVPVHQPVQLTPHQRFNRFLNNNYSFEGAMVCGLLAFEAFAVYKILKMPAHELRAAIRSDINRLRNLGTTIRGFNLRNIPHIQLPFFR